MAITETQYAVETFSLTKIFCDWWGRNKVLAVDDLNLQVRYNEVFGLLGPNGSGKTTTLKLLLGLLYPTKGRALVLGGDARAPKITAKIGFLPEESYLYKYLTARETLDFYGRLFGLPAKLRRRRIDILLEMAGLQAVANRPVGTFSKGMARRIGLAQALINDPELLILDEPTAGLDPIGTRQIKDLLIQLAKRGKTVLLCSHLLADVEDICDRIAILYGGRLQAQGRVKHLLKQTDRQQITTKRLSDTGLERIKRIIGAEQASCEITSPMDKLESFFIRTVTEAQQQALPTSGPVSAAGIGASLPAEDSAKSILDRLLSTPVSAEPPQTPVTEPVAPAVQADKTETDSEEDLLSKLTEQPLTASPEPLGKPQSPRDPEVKPEEVKKNILDQLTNQSDQQNSEDARTGKSETGDDQDE